MLGAIRNILVKHFIDASPDAGRTVLLTGAGRGGTTWLAEMLNKRNDVRYMFEPFYAGEIPAARAFRNWQYLRADEKSPDHLAFAATVITGRFRHERVDMYNRRLFCSRRLIKEVRANLMIGWLCENFPGMKVIHLVRHPFATVKSRLAHNRSIDIEGEFLAQRELLEDHLAPHLGLIAEARTDFERHMIGWSIEHAVAFDQLAGRKFCRVYYELLCANPRSEVRRALEYAGVAVDEARIDAVLRKPSSTALDSAAAIRAGADLVDTWRAAFTAAEVRRGLEILERFGLAEIYGDGLMPNSSFMQKAV